MLNYCLTRCFYGVVIIEKLFVFRSKHCGVLTKDVTIRIIVIAQYASQCNFPQADKLLLSKYVPSHTTLVKN